MSTLSLASDTSVSAKAAAATAGFLASLTSFTSSNAGNAGAGLFDALLADTKAAEQAEPETTNSQAATGTQSGSETNSADSQPAAQSAAQPAGAPADLHAALAALRQLLNSYRAASQPQTAAATTDTPTAVSAGTVSTTAPAAPVTPPASTTAAATPATTSADDTKTQPTTDAPPSLADLLAQLQGMLRSLQQQLPATPVAAAATDSGPSSNATPDLTNAGALLGDLQALMQSMQKALGQTAGTALTAAAGTTATGGVGNLAALATQLKAELKGAALGQPSTAAAPATATGGTGTADETSATNPTTTGLASTVLNPASAPGIGSATPAQALQSALAATDDLVRQFSAMVANATATATVTPLAGSASAATAGGDGGAYDADAGTGNGGGAASAAGPASGANAMAGLETAKGANPYSFASQLSAARAANGGTAGLPTAVEQVMLQLSRNVKSGNDQMSLQLHPAELGQINIKLSINADGKVQGTVTASNPATLELLSKDSKGLERALQDAGLTTDTGGLQFSLGNQSGNAQQQANGQAAAGQTDSSGDEAGTALAVNDTEAERYYVTPGRVNLKV